MYWGCLVCGGGGYDGFGMANLPGLEWCSIDHYIEWRDENWSGPSCGNERCICGDPGHARICDEYKPVRGRCAECGWSEATHLIVKMRTTCHCGEPSRTAANPATDPWEGRMNQYCYPCSLARCDTTDSKCPNGASLMTPTNPPTDTGALRGTGEGDA